MATVYTNEIDIKELSVGCSNYNIKGQPVNQHTLFFVKDEVGGYVPSYTVHEENQLIAGVKINILVADNGFIITSGKVTKIQSEQYGLDTEVRRLTNKTVTVKLPYDANQWSGCEEDIAEVANKFYYEFGEGALS